MNNEKKGILKKKFGFIIENESSCLRIIYLFFPGKGMDTKAGQGSLQ
jgi:hypothetical protein